MGTTPFTRTFRALFRCGSLGLRVRDPNKAEIARISMEQQEEDGSLLEQYCSVQPGEEKRFFLKLSFSTLPSSTNLPNSGMCPSQSKGRLL